MKKPFLVMVYILFTIIALASSTGKTMKDVINIPIQNPTEELPPDRPRSLPLFSASLDTDLNNLSVSTLYDVGDVDAVIENLTSGEYAEFLFDSAMIANLPISGNAGFWRITLTTEYGDVYLGEFEL